MRPSLVVNHISVNFCERSMQLYCPYNVCLLVTLGKDIVSYNCTSNKNIRNVIRHMQEWPKRKKQANKMGMAVRLCSSP